MTDNMSLPDPQSLDNCDRVRKVGAIQGLVTALTLLHLGSLICKMRRMSLNPEVRVLVKTHLKITVPT